MNIQRCENNHFYDADKYDHCPHCEGIEEKEQKLKGKEKSTSKHKRIFTNKENLKNEREDIREQKDNRTMVVSLEDDQQKIKSNISEQLNTMTPEIQIIKKEFTEKKEIINNITTQNSLEEEIQKARNRDDYDDEVTQGYFGTGAIEPVVGWLVCIEGENKGESYELQVGNNFIGRSSLMDVVILDDKKISRDKHAMIVYDPDGGNFLVLPGESKGLSYLNHELILQAKNLKTYDEIKLGDSTLLFVAFCGDKFSWNN
jgi:hypothetical protein